MVMRAVPDVRPDATLCGTPICWHRPGLLGAFPPAGYFDPRREGRIEATARGSLLAIMLALAAAGTLDLIGPDGQRLGMVREGPGGQLDLFDKESRRVGWGRCDRVGNCELFGTDGRRIGEAWDGRVILTDPARLHD